MIRTRLFLCTCLLFLFCILSNAQLILKITPPQLSELKTDNICELKLINPTKDSLQFKLFMNLESDTGKIYYQASSVEITISPRQSLYFKWDSIINKVESMKYKFQYSNAEHTILPIGLYRLCLFAIEYNSRRSVGKDCLQINLE